MKLRSLYCFGIAACIGFAQQGQGVRNPTPDEKQTIFASLHRLNTAINNRDLKQVHALTADEFYAFSEAFILDRNGLSKYSERRDDLGAVQIATFTRELRMVGSEVAITEGFFHTLRMKDRDLAGTFHCTLLKRNGVWLLVQADVYPSRFEAPLRFFAEPHPAAAPVGEWISLFDGNSQLSAFTSMDGSAPASVWSMEEGSTLRLTPQAGFAHGIRTRDTFRSFELEWEWKVREKGNSGLKYRNFFLTTGDAVGYEYQLVDDAGDAGAIRNPLERAGGLYAQISPSKAVTRPAGEFNRSRLVMRGRHCEHWLNGEKVLEYELNSDPFESPLVLQNQRHDIWFRNMRVRRLAD